MASAVDNSSSHPLKPLRGAARPPTTAYIVTTAMLSFISFWRAGAIVLCDFGSSAFYAGSIAEKAIGKAAPWFVLGIMLFANCVLMVYIESCSMFVRGGVYKVVKRAMGGPLAKLSVSALMFDYILTGPISAVSAGQYLIGFLNDFLSYLHVDFYLPRDLCSVIVALGIILYFWRVNVIGIEESSERARNILIISSIVGVLLLGFSFVTLFLHPSALPPFQPVLTDESLGWLKHWGGLKDVWIIGLLIGFGHSLLAMSGQETLAQVYREVEAPKLPNLKKMGIFIGTFAFFFTGILTLLAMMIIPDEIRVKEYSENLLAGLAMHVVGPEHLRFMFHGLVVFVGFLLLSGAVNTSFVGSNGVLNRVSEDGVLTDWFRIPHRRFGTTTRILNLVLFLQLFTVIACRGNIYTLGEAYAFGVIWSFTFMTLAMLILRFKDLSLREWKVPLNFHVKGREIPLGLGLIFLALFTLAVTNFFTKPIATQWGLVFSFSFFLIFVFSEKAHKKRMAAAAEAHPAGLGYEEKVNLKLDRDLDPVDCGVTKNRRILVTVRDPHNLYHVKKLLEELDPETTDLVVMTAKVEKPYQIEGDLTQLFPEEKNLLTHIVNLAESAGKSVIPIIVPARDPYFAIGKVAHDLNVDEVVVGRSGKMSAENQLENLAIAWGGIPDVENRGVKFRIIWPNREQVYQL